MPKFVYLLISAVLTFGSFAMIASNPAQAAVIVAA